MKSTIHSVVTVGLSAMFVTGVFAATPTRGEINQDLINAWFTPDSAKATPAGQKAAPTMQATKTQKGDMAKIIEPATRRELNSSM